MTPEIVRGLEVELVIVAFDCKAMFELITCVPLGRFARIVPVWRFNVPLLSV